MKNRYYSIMAILIEKKTNFFSDKEVFSMRLKEAKVKSPKPLTRQSKLCAKLWYRICLRFVLNEFIDFPVFFT